MVAQLEPSDTTPTPIPDAAMQLPPEQEDLILRYGKGRLGADPCPVPGCPISAQEHHRLARGIMAENTSLRRQVADLAEGQRSEAIQQARTETALRAVQTVFALLRNPESEYYKGISHAHRILVSQFMMTGDIEAS